MASEQTPQETPLETGEKDLGTDTTAQQTPQTLPSTEGTPETAPSTEGTPQTAPSTDADPNYSAAPETTTADEAPAKPSTKEKITGILHQTQDKIKGTVAGVKEKVSSKK